MKKVSMKRSRMRRKYREQEEKIFYSLSASLIESRQTVSKWESGSSYPEMEKILQLCDLFECPMDILIRGDAQESLREDTADYDAHMDRHSKEMTGGIAIIMAGVTFAAAAEGFRLPEFVMTAGALLLIIIGVLILIAGGMKHSRFKEKHLRIKPFYSEEERERADEKFTVRIVTGIGQDLCLQLSRRDSRFHRGIRQCFMSGVFLRLRLPACLCSSMQDFRKASITLRNIIRKMLWSVVMRTTLHGRQKKS